MIIIEVYFYKINHLPFKEPSLYFAYVPTCTAASFNIVSMIFFYLNVCKIKRKPLFLPRLIFKSSLFFYFAGLSPCCYAISFSTSSRFFLLNIQPAHFLPSLFNEGLNRPPISFNSSLIAFVFPKTAIAFSL